MAAKSGLVDEASAYGYDTRSVVGEDLNRARGSLSWM